MGDKGTWGLCIRYPRPFLHTNAPQGSYILGRAEARPHVPSSPLSRVMERFANLANPHSYRPYRISHTMERVLRHSVSGEHAP